MRSDPGGARRARHHHDRRRGDHRLRPHRQLVGLPDGRHDADHDLGGQAADLGLCAARRGDGAGGRLPGLCRPFGRRSARSATASPMAATRSAARSASRRSRSTRSATSSAMSASCAGLRERGMKTDRRASAGRRDAFRSAWSAPPNSSPTRGRSVRSIPRRASARQTVQVARGTRRHPARARRPHRVVPADGHHRSRAQRIVRPLRAGARPTPRPGWRRKACGLLEFGPHRFQIMGSTELERWNHSEPRTRLQGATPEHTITVEPLASM